MASTPISTGSRRAYIVLAICFLTSIFDGYDVIVYGSVLPHLLAEPGWHLGTAEAGVIASSALVGMLLGALLSGPVTDRIGRRRLILFSITWFTMFTALTAVAPSPEILGALRFLTGLGLGGVLPGAIALTIEVAPPARRQMFNGLMSAGFPLGGILAAVMGLVLLAPFGWRSMFLFGLVPTVLILPAAIAFLPRSPSDAGPAPARAGLRMVFGRGHARPTVVFGLASLCALLLAYGLNTWLPQIMREAGYPMGSSLGFLLALNLGAMVLGPVAGTIGDRAGPKAVVIASFVTASAALLAIGLRPGTTVLLIAVAVAGVGGTSTLALIDGYVACYYPPSVRASGLGVVLALARVGAILGPVLGGLILASGATPTWSIVAFAAPAGLGVLIIAFGPRITRARGEAPSPSASSRQVAARSSRRRS